MRWLVVGAKGMLGQDVSTQLRARGDEVRALGGADLDITDASATLRTITDVDIVVNCAAYTAVDEAQSDEEKAFAVNAVGAANVARAARVAFARIVHISTDYVFGGAATVPYAEDAPIAPRSAYGRTKAAGEWAVRAENPDHLVVRTAWLYGAHGACFPRTVARVAKERGALEVVDDQVGQPTWTRDLADLILALADAAAPAGTYHGTAAGQTSWHGFARAVVLAAGLDPHIVATTTSEAFVRPAPRPAYSVLGHEGLRRIGVDPIGDWAGRWKAAQVEVLAT